MAYKCNVIMHLVWLVKDEHILNNVLQCAVESQNHMNKRATFSFCFNMCTHVLNIRSKSESMLKEKNIL